MTRDTSTALVLTGLPASGKSTCGRALAAALDWPCFDKDDFLEALYGETLPSTREERRLLSRQSDRLFRDAATGARHAVLVSHWASPRGPEGTGTDSSWIDAHFARVIEVHCACSPETAAHRFIARRRHPGHLDHQRPPAQVIAWMQALAPAYPLACWPLITIDAQTAPDLDALFPAVRVLLADKG